MAYDDLIIGSGISALGVALALSGTGRRIACLAGDDRGQLSTYPGTNVPCDFTGAGGLGNFWHGVVPLAFSTGFENLDKNSARELLTHFYPGLSPEVMGSDMLFVPYRPIRPTTHFATLASRSKRLEVRRTQVLSLRRSSGGVTCETTQGIVNASRAWIACGALGTPRLLERSGLVKPRERTVSDHIIGYAGLIDSQHVPAFVRRPRRVSEGVLFGCAYDHGRSVLYMPRPARFDFSRLDAGMTKRALFGLPTSRIVAGLMGRFSLGLLSEAVYNKFGLFANARRYSVNYIAEAPALYRLCPKRGLLAATDEAVAQITSQAVGKTPLDGLEPTRRPDLFLPGVHLHSSLTLDEQAEFCGDGPISVVDASMLRSIGPEHHTFKMMALAHQRASAAS